MEKKIIRHNALERRKNIQPVTRSEKSKKIATALSALQEFKKADNVLFYYSYGTEVDTKNLIDVFIDQKKLYLPAIKNNELKAAPISSPLRLKRGIEGVLEPRATKESYEKNINLVIVPGVAFSKNGARLGMGKGYYDKYLATLDGITRIALAYQEQIFDHIPMQSYDELVDVIVTDKNIYRRNQ